MHGVCHESSGVQGLFRHYNGQQHFRVADQLLIGRDRFDLRFMGQHTCALAPAL
jgi:hypothetical protein